MVPPLVKVNAKYYGWRVALYIAGIMYVSIITTAVILHYGFYWLGLMPESSREAGDVARFELDYTFYMNLAAVALTAVMLWLRRRHRRMGGAGAHAGHGNGHGGGIGVQDVVTGVFILVLLGGGVALLVSETSSGAL